MIFFFFNNWFPKIFFANFVIFARKNQKPHTNLSFTTLIEDNKFKYLLPCRQIFKVIPKNYTKTNE